MQEEEKRQSIVMQNIDEAAHEDEISDVTEIIRAPQNEDMQYPRGSQAIGAQLELDSMASEHNSVMGHSPIKQRPIRSSRANKGKIDR